MIMNKITLLDLLKILYEDELLKIYMERPHKSEGYMYITTTTREEIFKDDELDYLLDNEIRVVNAEIRHDSDYGFVLQITVKEIPNESE